MIAQRWRALAIVAVLAVAMTGCDSVKSLVSGNDKTPLPGKRISVLNLEHSLKPDPQLNALAIRVPSPYVNVAWPDAGGYPDHAMYHLSLRERLDQSRDFTPADYDEARRIAYQARRGLGEIFAGVDVLLTFSAPGAAPKGLDWTGDPRFNRLWTLMGEPCVNVPAYVADGNLPVGVQVIARFGDDAGALAAARFVEQALARG